MQGAETGGGEGSSWSEGSRADGWVGGGVAGGGGGSSCSAPQQKGPVWERSALRNAGTERWDETGSRACIDKMG